MTRKKPVVKSNKRLKAVSRKKSAKKEVLVCSACHSPHASILIIDGIPRYVCQRCGHVSKIQVKQSLVAAHKLVKQRKSHLIKSHKMQQEHRHNDLVLFVNNYHLRMWFKIVSTFLLGLGIVLIPSVEFVTGILFLLIGIIGLYAGLKWV